jgi:hypothetical protein
VEITFVSDFPNPWKGQPAEELKHIKGENGEKWNPSIDDFLAVANHKKGKTKIVEISNFSGFLGGIQHEGGTSKTRVIKRINIITHATSGLIAFSGTIDANTAGVTLNNEQAWDGPKKGLDVAALNKLHEPSMSGLLADLQGKFCDGAEVFFYACNSGQGVNLALFQDFAKTFRVKVRGFDDSIWYLPTKTTPIDRNFTDLGPPPPASPPTNPQRGFKHLDSKVQKKVSP